MLYYINKRLFNLTSQLINKCVPIYVYIFTLIIFRFYNFDAGFSRAPVSPVINQSYMLIFPILRGNSAIPRRPR